MNRTAPTAPDSAEAHRPTSPRSRAVVDALVTAGLLDPVRRGPAADVVSDVLDGATRHAGNRRWLPELAGYLGGALVVAAALLFFVETWDDLQIAAQIGLLAVAAALLGVSGVVVRGGARTRESLTENAADVRRRLSATLTAGAAVCAAGAAGLVVDEIDGVDWGSWPGIAFALVLLVAGVLGYLWAPSVLGQLIIGWGATQFVGLFVFDVADLADDLDAAVFAVAALILGAAWIALAEARIWRERLAGRVIGAGLVALGAQWPMFTAYDELAYGLSILAAVAAFVAYVRLRAWPYLALGVGLVTVVVPEMLLDWTDGTLGVAGVLLVGGLILLAGSVLGLRIHREEPAER